MMARAARLGLILALLAAAPTLAAAACDGSVAMAPTLQTALYDPFRVDDVTLRGKLELRHAGDGECRLRVGFHRANNDNPTMTAIGGTNARLSYELTSNEGRRLVANWAQDSEPPIYLVAPTIDQAGQAVELNYQIRIPRGQLVWPGRYVDEIELRAYTIDGSDALATRPLTIRADVSSVASLNLVGADVGSPYAYTMDFGALETGKRRSIGIEARANGPFRLTVQSRERGVLRLAPPHDSWEIPYAATIGGARVDFPTVLGPYAPSRATGSVLPLEMTIGNTQGKRAGVYRDEITISIEPAT